MLHRGPVIYTNPYQELDYLRRDDDANSEMIEKAFVSHTSININRKQGAY